MSLSTEHLSLPPLVKGSLNGHLTIKVDDLIWCRQPPGDVYIECRWWGMSEAVVFRPLDVSQRDSKSQLTSSSLQIKEYTVTFDVRTSLTMLENYLKNCENLEFIVVKSKCYEKIGTVTVTDLTNLIKERMYQRYFPIINSFGNRIGDLHIGFSLWMKSKTDEEKENKLSANSCLDNSIRGKIKNRGKSLKICKRHSSMLKNSQNKVVSQILSKHSSTSESNKEKHPKSIESCKLMKHEIDPLVPPYSTKLDLDSILSRGEKLRNAMFSSLYEDKVFRKTMPLEPPNVTCIHDCSKGAHPSSSVATRAHNKAVLMDYLTGAEISTGEKQIAMETLKCVSPAESILLDMVSVEEVQSQPETLEPKLQEEGAVESNEADRNSSIAKESCKLDRMEDAVIASAPSVCEESQTQSQVASKVNHHVEMEESRLLQEAFRSVNCCRITVDYLKLESSNIGCNKKQCQQPGAVYFVEYNFNDIKQPLNHQYHTPVRYSTKKQIGPVVNFGQKHVHNLRKPFSVERLKASLQKANWKVLRRYLNQRVPSLIGTVSIDNFNVRLESNLRLLVKSMTGMLVGELFVQLELGKDRATFGNFLLGERILAFPSKPINQACVEIQTETSMSQDSLNNWTSYTTGPSTTNLDDDLPKQNAGKSHQFIIELDELTNHSTLLKSGKDEACYIDYKFPELDEKTNKIHFSNKFFTTDCVNCNSDIRFFFRHSHVLNASSLSQALLSAAIPGITFSLWTRKFHPGIHDHLVATAFLPTAKLCSMENQLNTQNSVVQESIYLPLTATSAIQHKGELHSKSRCSLHLVLTYRQITFSSHGEKTTAIKSSVGLNSSNTEATDSDRPSTDRQFNELENYVERDKCIAVQSTEEKESHFPSSEKNIRLEQIDSHKYCVKDSCVCRNYHSLFSGEKTRSSKYSVMDARCNSLVEKQSMNNNNGCRQIDVEKKIALDTVNNPAISSILNSQLSEECQKKFVNFILHGNTKLSVAARCDGLINEIDRSKGNSDFMSKIKYILSHCSLDNMNKNCTTVQHVHIPQSANVNEIHEMDQLATRNELQVAEMVPDINTMPPHHNQQFETEESVNDVEHINRQSLNATPNPQKINTIAESNDSVNHCNRNQHDKYSLDMFKVISPPAGFENSPSSSIQNQDQYSDSQERLRALPARSHFQFNENSSMPSASDINLFQQTGFISQENMLKDEKFFFKPLHSDKRVMSSASDIFDLEEKRPASFDNRLESSQKRRSNFNSDSNENINFSRSSRASQELQQQQNYLESQLSSYDLESGATCRAESLYELEMQSGGEDGEDLLSVVTRSVENVQLDSNWSGNHYQEHDIDDLLTESQQRKSAGSHSMESTGVDSVKVSSELRNVLKHLSPSNKNDDVVYDRLLCELKAYVDNVAKEIRSQLDLIESNLHESNSNTENLRSDLLSTGMEGNKEREDISSAKTYSIDSHNDCYVYNTECAPSATRNSNHSESSGIKESGSNAALPIASPQCSVDSLSISRNRLQIDECSASSEVFSKSTSSAFTKYKSIKTHKKQKLFKAKVEVERGYHLPKVTNPFSHSGFAENPNTFVKLQTSCLSLDEGLFSNVVENSCDPVWMASFDVDLPAALLKQGVGERLVVQVFEKRQRVTQLLGTAAICLGVLRSGLALVSGWFNLFDVSGVCKGQIRVKITPLDNVANLQLDSPDSSVKVTVGTSNDNQIVDESCQKHSGNSIFSNVEIDGTEKLHGRNNQTPSVQLTTSLKSKLSELELLIDALKMKFGKCGRSVTEETAERLPTSRRSLSIDQLAMADSNENVDETQSSAVSKILTGSSCSNEVGDFNVNRKSGSEYFSRNCTDQEEAPSDDNRREDDFQFRTYSIHSYDDESSTKTDTPDNIDQE